ncbi:lytic transglycosylase domain-containing protein [Novosphingobium sp. ERN07]|uniref:lytic transglycosylase domain-containing protein n=1 Tax=Novosphingobium sp. ERN07 TaxID=2726187 RepID=UPI0014576C20|nr:lytic transglycosylase domain-containing protein [Novosphingobium sp. ERN07]NLR73394.1 lytic transglycosylase domain-containing protein [Novosphingobium sp. ERN07]
MIVIPRSVASFACFAACALPQLAHAQVYEINDGNVVQVRTGGGAVAWRNIEDVSAIVPQRGTFRAVSSRAASSLTRASQFRRHLERAADNAGLPTALLEALVWQESRWNASAVSPKGAVGLTQLMPRTARELGVNPYEPAANLIGGAQYLRKMLNQFDGNLVHALAAYNAGARRVQQAGGVPRIKETREYVAAILSRLQHVRTSERPQIKNMKVAP